MPSSVTDQEVVVRDILNASCVLKMDTWSLILYIGSRGQEEVWMWSTGSPNSGTDENIQKLYTGIHETFYRIHHRYLGGFFTDYSKDNSYVNNYNLYATVCYSIPMSPLIVSVFLYFDIILFIRKEKKKDHIFVTLLFSHILYVSPIERKSFNFM